MSQQTVTPDTTHIPLGDPWKILGDCELLENETRDVQQHFRAAKTSKQWSDGANELPIDLFCPKREEAGAVRWDIFRPSEREGDLRVRRRSPLVVPIKKRVKSLLQTKNTNHLIKSFAQGLYGATDIPYTVFNHNLCNV